jgi:hypothetical protein
LKHKSRIAKKDLSRPRVSSVVLEEKRSDGRLKLRDWQSYLRTLLVMC